MNFTQAHNDYLDPEKHDVPKQKKPREPNWCPRCGGKEVIHVGWEWGSSGHGEEIIEVCPECRGSGIRFDEDEDEI